MTHDLLLHEELLLLALNEDGSGRADTAIGGGLLAELAFQGFVTLEEQGRKTIVRAQATTTRTGDTVDEVLEECLAEVNESSKLRDAAHWVGRFSRLNDLTKRVALPLVERGIIDEGSKRILFFDVARYPERNPVPEALMTERIREAIEHEHMRPTDRTIALVALANASGLLGNNLDKKMLRAQRKRIKTLSEDQEVAAAVKASIDAIVAATVVMIAVSGAT